ncbi:MAG TPA: hypothetical protein VFL55_14510 [Acetobacteraceae bacterium]|nr:hypothetical protein [Acetobacteraceae bacterium]
MAMSLHCALAGIIMMSAASAARAQDATAVRHDCQDDYQQFCAGGEDDPLPFKVACLKQSYINLSERCRTALLAPRDQEQR